MPLLELLELLELLFMVESFIVEPELFGLRMVEPEVLGRLVPVVLVLLSVGVLLPMPDEVDGVVDGVVMVLASVERPVLGMVGVVPLDMLPLLPVDDPLVEPLVEPVGAAEPGLVVPVVDGVVAVGLVDDGPAPVAPVAPPAAV